MGTLDAAPHFQIEVREFVIIIDVTLLAKAIVLYAKRIRNPHSRFICIILTIFMHAQEAADK